jgi:hypothetical protein
MGKKAMGVRHHDDVILLNIHFKHHHGYYVVVHMVHLYVKLYFLLQVLLQHFLCRDP